jgi:hypothetical protein
LLKGKTTLLTLPILSQILCCINLEASRDRLQNASFVFSGNLAGLLTAAPKFGHAQGPRESILLLSGISSENEGECPPKDVLYAVVWLENCEDPYMVGNHRRDEPFGVLVQLAPTFRLFSPSRPLSPDTPTLLPRMEFGKDIHNPFEIKIQNSSYGWAQLSLEQDILTYARVSWVWGEQERRESFRVETVELILF